MNHDYKQLISNQIGDCQLSKVLENLTEKFLGEAKTVLENPEEIKRMGIAYAAGMITCIGIFQEDKTVLSAIQNLEIKEIGEDVNNGC